MLQAGPNYDHGSGGRKGYNTHQQAVDDGAVVMGYGYVELSHSSLGVNLFWGTRG